MATRHERVVLSLQDEFTSPMARAAASAQALDKSLDSLGKRSVSTSRSQAAVSRDLDKTASSAARADHTINNLTGRMRLLGQAVAVLGPTLSPIGAVAAAGVGGLANQLGVAVLAGGAAVVAFQGVGEALKAVNEAALEPTTENLAKANEAMMRLSPAARDAVRAMRDLRPTLLGIRDAGAGAMMPGFVDLLGSLERRGDDIERIVSSLSGALGDLMSQGGKSLESGSWDRFFDFLATDARETLTELGFTVGNLTRGFSEMWMAFDPINDDFSGWLRRVSEDFASWSEGLSSNTGFHDFIAYVRESGPQVAAAFSSMGDALLQVMVAAAPIGGPVLSALESVANVVARIAESDLGTPLLAGMAALSLFNRTATVTAGISARLGAGGVMGAVLGPQVGAAGGGAKRLVGSMRDDLAAISDSVVAFGSNAEKAAAASERMRSRLGGLAKAGAGLAGVGLAASGAAEGIGAANTISLGLMGTLAGPWGAAVGASAGLLMDMSKQAGDTFDALDQLGMALDRVGSSATATDLESLNAQLTIAAERVQALGDMRDNPFDSFGNFLGSIKQDIEDTFGAGDIEEAEGRLADYEAQMGDLQRVAANTEAHESQMAAIRQTGAEATKTAESFIGLGKSLNDGKVDLAGWLKELEQQNRALRDFRVNAAEAGRKGLKEGLIKELQEAGPEGALRMRELAGATETQIRRANRAWQKGQNEIAAYSAAQSDLPDTVVTHIATKGMPKTMGDIARLTEKYNLTPEQVDTLVQLSGVQGVLGELATLNSRLASITQPRVISISYTTSGVPILPSQTRRADGGFVPKTGLPYADRHPYLLADGEGVTTNRNGETDKFRDVIMGINAGMSRGDIKGMLADGGIVGMAGGGIVPSGRYTQGQSWDDLLRVLSGAADSLAGASRDAVEAARIEASVNEDVRIAEILMAAAERQMEAAEKQVASAEFAAEKTEAALDKAQDKTRDAQSKYDTAKGNVASRREILEQRSSVRDLRQSLNATGKDRLTGLDRKVAQARLKEAEKELAEMRKSDEKAAAARKELEKAKENERKAQVAHNKSLAAVGRAETFEEKAKRDLEGGKAGMDALEAERRAAEKVAADAEKRRQDMAAADEAARQVLQEALESARSLAQEAVQTAEASLREWTQKMEQVGQSVVAQFAPNLFADGSPSSPWMQGKVGSDPAARLAESIAGLSKRQQLQAQLSGMGLSGDAFAAISSGSNDDLAALVAQGPASVSSLAAQYAQYQALQASVASSAGRYAYGSEADVAQAQVDAAKRDVALIEKFMAADEKAWQKRVRDIGKEVGVNISTPAARGAIAKSGGMA